jgi:CBS domain-containing protein
MAPRLICSEGPPIMTIPLIKPLIVKPDDEIIEVAKKMKENDASTAVILDDSGKVVGVVSDRDIVTKLVAEGKPYTTKVDEIMDRDPLIGRTTWTLAKALEAMAAVGVRHMIVVDEHETLVGILSIKDLVQHIIEEIDIHELVAAE